MRKKTTTASLLRTLGIAVITAATIALAACASINQTIRIAPLPGDYAVSASSSLLVNGQTIPESDLKVVKYFHFTTYASPRLKERDVQIGLAADLKKILDDAGANGIIKLRITTTNIDTSALSWIVLERYAGITGVLSGLAVAGTVAGYPSTYSSQATGWAIGIAAVGAVLLGGSLVHESVATVGYVIDIDGTAVIY
jgi:hypothetical protein